MDHIFKNSDKQLLEAGSELPGYQLAYCTYGKFEGPATKVIWVCHALTANADVATWWPGLFGEGKVFDPENNFIICVNMPGSCYGSTGPGKVNKYNREAFENIFPLLTIRDIVAMQINLRKHLGIKKIHLLLGGSMGGQQAMEWAVAEPEVIKNLVLLATNAAHSPWGIAFNEAQRMALVAGPDGIQAARAVAMLSYRNYEMYTRTAKGEESLEKFGAAGYQNYHGEKLAKRFTAESYYVLSKTMDSHNIGRGRVSAGDALNQIQAATLVIGIKTDILFPPAEQIFLAENISRSQLQLITSPYGHDGFLTEGEKINNLILDFLQLQQE